MDSPAQLEETPEPGELPGRGHLRPSQAPGSSGGCGLAGLGDRRPPHLSNPGAEAGKPRRDSFWFNVTRHTLTTQVGGGPTAGTWGPPWGQLTLSRGWGAGDLSPSRPQLRGSADWGPHPGPPGSSCAEGTLLASKALLPPISQVPLPAPRAACLSFLVLSGPFWSLRGRGWAIIHSRRPLVINTGEPERFLRLQSVLGTVVERHPTRTSDRGPPSSWSSARPDRPSFGRPSQVGGSSLQPPRRWSLPKERSSSTANTHPQILLWSTGLLFLLRAHADDPFFWNLLSLPLHQVISRLPSGLGASGVSGLRPKGTELRHR
ncbi:uncharacterized protein [Canis lupus baileyi]|uniref:uncharacterized protein n=1 Tax=Canis lupus baileyi TaxID=143281 RepID=UPI003B9732D6